MSLKIMLVDDIPIFLQRYKDIIEVDSDFEVVCQASSGSEAVELAAQYNPDVILMDIQMENDDAGIVATRKILSRNPNIKIIAVTVHDDDEIILSAFDAGVCEYIMKTESDESIVQTIKSVIGMEKQKNRVNELVRNELVSMRKERESLLYCATLISRLSRTEIEVLKLLCDGKTYQEIADIRLVEHGTIRVIVNKISKKLGGKKIRDIIGQLNRTGVMKLLNKF